MTRTTHLYLSPHLDDAVLSCGGLIRRQTAAGDRVLVVTFFTADATSPGGPADLSPFALVQHGYWGNHVRPMRLRRAEDVAALTLLEAEWYHVGYLDAVYRAGARGQWLYVNMATLFGQVQSDDPMLSPRLGLAGQIAGLAPRGDEVILYAPLAAGHHVDHQIIHGAAREVARRGYRVLFYEDYPYAGQPEAVPAALAAAGGPWPDEVVRLTPADVGAWAAAVGYYRSQLGVLFRGAEAMPGQVWSFAASRLPEPGLAVRLYRPPDV